jgi:chemotaxis protein CheX
VRPVNPILDAHHLHAEWIALIDTAAREVFDVMLGSQLRSPADESEGTVLNVTAMVGLAGKLCGVMSVQCDGNSAELMASKMLGVDCDRVGGDASDAIGEVCNMIAGHFKNKITGLGEGCMLSPPTVITGSDYSLRSLADKPVLQVRLLFEGRPILISLQINFI